MKKTIALVLCLMLAMVSVLALASCEKNDPPAETKNETQADTPAETQPESQTPDPVESDTEAPETEAPDTEAPETNGSDETDDPSADTGSGEEPEYDPEEYVVIRTAEDLMKFNEEVNSGDVDHCYKTVLFLDDIDMTGYTWTPLDGYWVEGVIFDGQNHTISNLTFEEFNPDPYGATTDFGSGFIGVNYYSNTFQNITFKNASVVAKRSHVACIIGTNRCDGGDVFFDNVHIDGFSGLGECEGIGTTIRVGGFIGCNAAGFPTFNNCSAKNLQLSGFHNLAAFVGYDMANTIAEQSFDDCVVENCQFTFSYCQSDSYTTDMPRKFVSVFYNASNWADNVDYVADRGNTFADVFYYDWTDDNREYRAEEFRSWTREEAEAAAQG